jgi:23S rRNA pseudouridine1911/1915/1917 synthase
MGLHALRLNIAKPGTNKPLVFETPAPADFLALLR